MSPNASDLPDGWTTTTISELLDGGLFVDGDWVESKDQDPAGNVRLIQLADIGDGVFRDRSSRFLTESKARELNCTYLNPGDVLVARMPEPLGRACVFPGVGQPAVTAVDVCILRPSPEKADRLWLMNALNAPQLRSAMQEHVRGTTRQRISRRNLGILRLPLPPRDVQSCVAVAVADLQARRGSADGHIRSAKAAIERFRQSVLAAACAGRLTAEWREEHPVIESARELIERSQRDLLPIARGRRQAQATTAPDWLEIPETWEWASLASVAEIRGGIQKQPKRTPQGNAFPYLRVANVLRGRLDLREVHQFELFPGELETYRLLAGDLLVVEGNGSATEIGRSAIWDGAIEHCVHQNHIIRVRCVHVDPRFIDLVWNSPVGAREIAELAVTSAGLYSLSVGKIGSFTVPIPPIEEQREIVRRASSLLAAADAQLVRVDAAAGRVDRSSQAILAKAFRGELLDGASHNMIAAES